MQPLHKILLLSVICNMLCVFLVRTQNTDLHMEDIVPLSEPQLNENVRYRAVSTNNGPEALPENTEVSIIWTVQGQSVPARYELEWPVGDTFRLLSPPFMFLRPDSFQVCAEFDYPADSITSNHKVCITQVLTDQTNSIAERNQDDDYAITNEGRAFYLTGSVPKSVTWQLFDLSGKLRQTYEGERFIPRVKKDGIFILRAVHENKAIAKKVMLRR